MKILNKIEKQLTINEGFYNIDDLLTLSATCTNEKGELINIPFQNIFNHISIKDDEDIFSKDINFERNEINIQCCCYCDGKFQPKKNIKIT